MDNNELLMHTEALHTALQQMQNISREIEHVNEKLEQWQAAYNAYEVQYKIALSNLTKFLAPPF